jgi:hypothetical protein
MPDKPSPEKFGAKSCILCDANSPSFFRFCLSKAQLVASRNVAFLLFPRFLAQPAGSTLRHPHQRRALGNRIARKRGCRTFAVAIHYPSPQLFRDNASPILGF